MRTRTAILLALTAYTGYLAYVPVPPGIQEPLKFRFCLSATKFIFHVSTIRSLLPNSNINLAAVSTIRFMTEGFNNLPARRDFGPGVSVTKTTFNGVKVHVYVPSGEFKKSLPGFIYYHGGGLAIFSADYYAEYTKWMAHDLNAVVVSVDYRRTPEVKFPEPLNDCIAATKWFLQHAKEYNVDPTRIGAGGDSAGGYLTATVSHAIHDDTSLPNLKLQVLIYPWLQSLDLNFPSYQKYSQDLGEAGATSLRNMAFFSSLHAFGLDTTYDISHAYEVNNHTSSEFTKSRFYQSRLGHDLVPAEFKNPSFYSPPDPFRQTTDDNIWKLKKDVFKDAKFSPMLRKNLSGLPKAFIATMEYDSLRDEGIIYGKLLQKAGVDVTWKDYPGAFHGVCWISKGLVFEYGTRINEEIFDFIRRNI